MGGGGVEGGSGGGVGLRGAWATIFDISHQSLPGFTPFAMQWPHHYLATAVLYFYIEVQRTDFVKS